MYLTGDYQKNLLVRFNAATGEKISEIACLAAGFTACNDDDCEDLHLGNLAHYPNVLKGTFPTESQVLELGETLEITPELLNPEEATYSWLVNGKEYSTEPTFSYKIDNPCRADLTCIIKNKYGKVEMSVLIPVNNAKLRVNFANGVITPSGITPATFSTSDPVVQTAIENNRLYLKGMIKLEKSFKIGEVEVDDEKPASDEEKNEKEPESQSSVKSYPDVKNVQSAREILIREYNVPIAELQDKERIKMKSEELGIEFPNWK